MTDRGYTELTPVQVAVIAPGTEARDLLVSAQTGSGKTVAYGLAFAATLLGAESRFPPAGNPLALIVAPTRELAMQVHRELSWLYAGTGARILSCIGGMDAQREGRALEQGSHIVVGTPGRLCDHLQRGRLKLGDLRVAVLDEADEMLDLGFREELDRLIAATPAWRRTLLFSATIAREITAMARQFQQDALRIDTLVRNQPHADIEYRAVQVAHNEVEHAVVNVLRYFEAPTALVFCATRDGVRHLHASLQERGFTSVALSGELTQNERTRALQSMRDGQARVCVATGRRAARGLDLPDLALVVHADLPTRPRQPAASQRPHRPRRPQGHLRAGGADAARAPGRGAVRGGRDHRAMERRPYARAGARPRRRPADAGSGFDRGAGARGPDARPGTAGRPHRRGSRRRPGAPVSFAPAGTGGTG